MADHQGGSTNRLFGGVQHRAPNPTQLVGFLTLIVSGGILLMLSGLTITGLVMGLIAFAPVILVTGPLWFPAAVVLFIAAAVVLSTCGVGVAVLAAVTWLYRYFTGKHPWGTDRLDYARSRIADTATHVKDYAREYGGYLQSRVKDAAPGA
ncbi:oleosin-like [Dioscorea cayenensis subsp. rotundata]|uniref:Oleosin-like n=1 Tax=Dioscorea cayennensis subsp. rotundata TaxID=55577 RepID=A0AB40ANF9_DIOCR|nr:oleosin-like [Dioscorea cayenensis subsp. rotundata]